MSNERSLRNLTELIYSQQDLENNILPSRFHVGQLVSCVVLQLDDDKKDAGKRKLWLSLCLSLLHKGFTLDAVQEGMVCLLVCCLSALLLHWEILDFHFNFRMRRKGYLFISLSLAPPLLRSSHISSFELTETTFLKDIVVRKQ